MRAVKEGVHAKDAKGYCLCSGANGAKAGKKFEGGGLIRFSVQ
jgi:hypothetical protein